MSLWRRPEFVKLWAGQTISEIGSRVSREGIPLTAVLVLHASPAQMGWLTAIGGLAALLAGPLAGAMAGDALRPSSLRNGLAVRSAAQVLPAMESTGEVGWAMTSPQCCLSDG